MCSIQENIVSVHDDNLEAVDLEALISSSSARKHPIGIVATTYSLEWSSSKGGVISDTLKIQKNGKARVIWSHPSTLYISS